MLREASFAGRFYPSNPEKLKETIKKLFRHDLGPGGLPSAPPGENRAILGVMAPHAGYAYSGAIAAHAYYTLYEDGAPETFIMLGPNHTQMGHGISVYPNGKWQTPLGEVEIDEEVVSSLVKNKIVKKGKMAHSGEHSLEIQLPFLQFLFPEIDFKIVPVTIRNQSMQNMKKLAGRIINTMENSVKDITILASTDMSHYVPYEKAKKDDNKALRAIEDRNIEELYEMVENGYSMCGYGPVSTLIFCAKHWNALGGTLAYATSGDITGEKNQVVGYGALAFTHIESKEKEQKKKIKEKAAPT